MSFCHEYSPDPFRRPVSRFEAQPDPDVATYLEIMGKFMELPDPL